MVSLIKDRSATAAGGSSKVRFLGPWWDVNGQMTPSTKNTHQREAEGWAVTGVLVADEAQGGRARGTDTLPRVVSKLMQGQAARGCPAEQMLRRCPRPLLPAPPKSPLQQDLLFA